MWQVDVYLATRFHLSDVDNMIGGKFPLKIGRKSWQRDLLVTRAKLRTLIVKIRNLDPYLSQRQNSLTFGTILSLFFLYYYFLYGESGLFLINYHLDLYFYPHGVIFRKKIEDIPEERRPRLLQLLTPRLFLNEAC